SLPFPRTPTALVDESNTIFAMLVGKPSGSEPWDLCMRDAETAMEAARVRIGLQHSDHRRGNYASISTGFSFGGGQQLPMNKSHSARRQGILADLCNTPALQRIAGFVNYTFACYFPKLWRYYVAILDVLMAQYPDLRKLFDVTPFPMVSFNLSPNATTYEHRDAANFAPGLCGIIAGGKFDHRKGGHLVLRPLRVAIQFPLGSLVYIPSAVLEHGNTCIQPGERRWAMVSFAAGGLF
ncbi:hypothetical protein CERSUDRAFT_45923, partial [Gelatoporia subvermispora B]